MNEIIFPPDERLTANTTNSAFPVLTVLPRVHGHTPRRLGCNLEMQEYADRINLWDWIADSHVSAVRQFHPEFSLRSRPGQPGEWGKIEHRDDFDAFRVRLVNNPFGGGVHWDAYRFDENIPWIGVPDQMVERLAGLGIEVWLSLNYVPSLFSRPLIKDPEFIGLASDEMIDWEAAAAAYEYYFASMFRYASRAGVRRFLMVNEPEFRWNRFALPERVKAIGKDWFRAFFRGANHEAQRSDYFAALATQYGVLAKVARFALEDVQHALSADTGSSVHLKLAGPVTGKWETLWPAAAPYLDVFDYHQYGSESEAYEQRFRRVVAEARERGHTISISEFNLQAGPMDLSNHLLTMDASLALAEVLMRILSLPRIDDPCLEMACLYLFHFPATHRNYKALIYGDMNLVDWSGRDTALGGRSDEWRPSPEEMQLRFATPAYDCFRMLARCVGDGPGGTGLERLESPLTLRDSAVAPAVYGGLRAMAVRRARDVVIHVLNLHRHWTDTFLIDLSHMDPGWKWAVIRETSLQHRDEVTAEIPIPEDRKLPVPLPPRSLVQVIVSPLDPSAIESVRLMEHTATPGTLGHLRLWQTTRLRAMARLKNGEEVDVTHHNIVWRSEAPWLVRVGQGGLVQRLRPTSRPVRIEARLADGRVLAGAEVAPCSEKS